MSWNRASKDLPHFRSKTFLQDAPISDKTPNWNSYRQTLARMKTLRSQSQYWRATCSFDQMQQKIDYRDYLRDKFSDFEIMTHNGNAQCFPVDYVNMRQGVAPQRDSRKFSTLIPSTPTAILPATMPSNLTLELLQVKTTLVSTASSTRTSAAPRQMIRQPDGGSVDTWMNCEVVCI